MTRLQRLRVLEMLRAAEHSVIGMNSVEKVADDLGLSKYEARLNIKSGLKIAGLEGTVRDAQRQRKESMEAIRKAQKKFKNWRLTEST